LYFYLRTAKKEFISASRIGAAQRSLVESPVQTPGAMQMDIEEDTDDIAGSRAFKMDIDDKRSTNPSTPLEMKVSTEFTKKASSEKSIDQDTLDLLICSDPSTPVIDSSTVVDKLAEDGVSSSGGRSPVEYVEEIMAILKTAHPLLALSIETMVDQMLSRLKPSLDEDVNRMVVALLTEGYQQLYQRLVNGTAQEDSPLVQTMISTMEKFSATNISSMLKVCANLRLAGELFNFI
jgi:hypothetical protein